MRPRREKRVRRCLLTGLKIREFRGLFKWRSAKSKIADAANDWPPMGLILLPEPGKIIFPEAFRATLLNPLVRSKVFRGHESLVNLAGQAQRASCPNAIGITFQAPRRKLAVPGRLLECEGQQACHDFPIIIGGDDVNVVAEMVREPDFLPALIALERKDALHSSCAPRNAEQRRQFRKNQRHGEIPPCRIECAIATGKRQQSVPCFTQ